MEWEGTEAVIFAVLGLLGLCSIVIFLFTVFQKKKNALLKIQFEAEKNFEQQIVESQIEIREQTLRNISWELHDNIGQLLTLSKIQLQSIPEHPELLKDVNDNISKILTEVRALSRIINPDFIANISLIEAINLEIDRFNRLSYINAVFTVNGEPKAIDSKSEIVLFRILQEFFSNTIKHSKATTLFVDFAFENNKLTIISKDNGIGFDVSHPSLQGLGIGTMQKRGKLINSEVKIASDVNKGTTISIIHPIS